MFKRGQFVQYFFKKIRKNDYAANEDLGLVLAVT